MQAQTQSRPLAGQRRAAFSGRPCARPSRGSLQVRLWQAMPSPHTRALAAHAAPAGNAGVERPHT